MKRTREYSDKCFDIAYNGGKAWLIKRIDKNEFLAPDMQMWRSDQPMFPKDKWNQEPSFLCYIFLTKQDAEDELPYFNLGTDIQCWTNIVSTHLIIK